MNASVSNVYARRTQIADWLERKLLREERVARKSTPRQVFEREPDEGQKA